MSNLGDFFGIIRVERVPSGEAPEDIRKAWVGVEVPCLFWSDSCASHYPYRVLSRTHLELGKRYVVPQKEAILALGRKSRGAAEWWKKHGFPEEDGARFAFLAGEVVEVKPVLSRREFLDLMNRLHQLILG